jgi:hypothetical protein
MGHRDEHHSSVPQSPPAAFSPVPNRGMITLSIMLANIMQGVDNTILNVALPEVQGSLSSLAGPDRLGVDLLLSSAPRS